MTIEEIDKLLDNGPFGQMHGYSVRMLWNAWEASRVHCTGVAEDPTSKERFRVWLLGPMAGGTSTAAPSPSILPATGQGPCRHCGHRPLVHGSRHCYGTDADCACPGYELDP